MSYSSLSSVESMPGVQHRQSFLTRFGKGIIKAVKNTAVFLLTVPIGAVAGTLLLGSGIIYATCWVAIKTLKIVGEVAMFPLTALCDCF